MIRSARSRSAQETEQSGIWLSIGDLMSVLLLLFAFLFVLAMLQLQEEAEKSKQPRIIVIQSLVEQLDASGIHVETDKNTGDISLTESILFDFNKAELKPEGQDFLKKFIPIYANVIFSSDIIEHEIVRVIIEGHTSSAGSFTPNMNLSVMRAASVSSFISSFMFDHKHQFQQKLTIAGRGEIEADQHQDLAKDRVVKFRFQFREINIKDLLPSMLVDLPSLKLDTP